MFETEAAEERLPGPVHLVFGDAGPGGPQPYRVRVAVPGQVPGFEADEDALHCGELSLMLFPAGPAEQFLVHPRPRRRLGGAVPGGVRPGGDGGFRPGSRVGELERGTVPGRTADHPGPAGRGREVHHPVAPQPPAYLQRQVAQQPGEPGQVVAGIEEDRDVRVVVLPVPRADDPRDDVAELGRGDLGGIIGGPGADRVQRQRPRRPAGSQRGNPGVRPARDQLRVALPPRVAVAEQPLRAGLRIRPQPVRDIGCQPDPAVVPGRERDRVYRAAQPGEHDTAAVQRVVDAAVAAAALRLQGQLREHQHPLLPARQRVRHVEQRVPAHPEGQVQLVPEPGQPPGRFRWPILVSALVPGHNERHQPSPRCLQDLCKEPEDHPAAADSCQHATQGTHKQLGTAQETRLKWQARSLLKKVRRSRRFAGLAFGDLG